MSKIKEETKKLLAEARALFKEVFGTEQKFADYKLDDGTIIRVDTEMPQEGSAVTVIGQDGEVPLTDGEYVVDINGQKMKITVQSGYITKAEAEQAPAGDVAKPAEQPMGSDEFATEARAKFDELFKRIAELEGKLTSANTAATNANTLATKYKEDFNKVSELNKKMFELVESLGSTPSAAPVTAPVTRTQTKHDSFEDEIKAFRKANKI